MKYIDLLIADIIIFKKKVTRLDFYKNINIKFLIWIIMILLSITYVFICPTLFIRAGTNSDYANLVLEAKAICNGNLFLSGWNLTGVTFYTTDLLFYVISYKILGFTPYVVPLASTGMYLLTVFAAIILSGINRQKFSIQSAFITFSIIALPSLFLTLMLLAHTAGVAYILIALIFLQLIYKNINKTRLILLYCIYAFFMILATTGDSLTIITGVVPIIIVSIISIFINKNAIRIKDILIISLSIFSIIIGKLLNFIIHFIGKFNENEYLSSLKFVEFNNIGKNIGILSSSILKLFGADFFGKKIISLSTFKECFHFLIFLLVIFSISMIIRDLIKKKTFHRIELILISSMIFAVLVLTFTSLLVDETNSRYITNLVIFGAVLISRLFTGIFEIQKKFKPLFIIISLFILMSFIYPINYKRPEVSNDRLSNFLISKNLTYGYTSFWNASNTTLLSKEKVKLRSIVEQKYLGELYPHKWFCDDNWYSSKNYANFIVIDDTGYADLTEPTIIKIVGQPLQILKFENYTIMIWNKNISDCLKQKNIQ